MGTTCTPTPLTPADNSGLPTFQQAMDSNELVNASGVCGNSPEFAEMVNNATDRLMYRGDWPGTRLPIQLNVTKGLVTFPRQVGTVRYLNVAKRYVEVANGLYNFLPWSWNQRNCCDFFGGWWDHVTPILTQYGTSCTFAQPPTSTCVLQISGIPDDTGAILQFFGSDPSGNALRTDNGDGTFSDGIKLTLNQPFTIGTDLVQFVGRCIKPVTQGSVSLAAIDTTSGVTTPLAVYDPGDTNPSFAQYNLHSGCFCCPTQPTWSAVAMVKLKFIKVVAPTDLVLIPNLHALALFIKGQRYQDSGDRKNGLEYQADAVKELNLQLADASPDEQIALNINPFGTAYPARAGVGRLL